MGHVLPFINRSVSSAVACEAPISPDTPPITTGSGRRWPIAVNLPFLAARHAQWGLRNCQGRFLRTRRPARRCMCCAPLRQRRGRCALNRSPRLPSLLLTMNEICRSTVRRSKKTVRRHRSIPQQWMLNTVIVDLAESDRMFAKRGHTFNPQFLSSTH